ncbi:MAG: hypothetical protein M3R14_07865 [Acidobacteriota bacterium]|nr:hypothetical protein [Acidobacteriota bacterium]
MDTKICCRCKSEKPIEEFAKKTKTRLQSHCNFCQREYLRNHYANNKNYYKNRNKLNEEKNRQFIIEMKNKPCADCGKTYPPYVMDFDHKGNKSFTIGASLHNYHKKVVTEIAKCDVVCANCHRERTFGKKSSFDSILIN